MEVLLQGELRHDPATAGAFSLCSHLQATDPRGESRGSQNAMWEAFDQRLVAVNYMGRSVRQIEEAAVVQLSGGAQIRPLQGA
jgi:hypothetical protein